MGHSPAHLPWVKSCIVALGVAVCAGLVVPAPAAAALSSGASPASGAELAEQVGVNDCHSTDNGDPRLVDFRYGPGRVNVVDTRAEVHFRVRARDTGGPGPASGVRSVLVWFGRLGGDEPGTEGHHLTQGTDGWWVGSVVIPRRSPHRLWPVEGLELRDRAGHLVSYSRAALQKLSGRSLDVAVTTARDRTPPRLTAFSVTPKTVDTRTAAAFVTFTARMVDRQSDVEEVVVDGRGDTSWLARDTGSISLAKVAGSRHLFRARVPVAQWVGDRRWRTAGVWAWNSADELAGYTRSQLLDAGFAGDFAVTSERDGTRPEARSFEVSPTALDVRTSDAAVSFRVRAADAGSGVHSVVVTTESEDFWVVLTRESGTSHEGIWSGTTHVRHCRTSTATWRLALLVYDGNGDYFESTAYGADDLAALGWPDRIRVRGGDLERPRVERASRIRPAGPVRLSFTEAVRGIDPADARLHRIRPDRSLGRALAGTWRCRDRAGDRASCRTGSVREARFRPSEALRANATYAVALNPEHSLGVVDLAGNPMRRTYRRLRAIP